jgi:hypothetical protein
MHPNPRTAQACSKCGSRDFSTPQPKVPWWAPLLEFVLSSIPGVILIFALVLGVVAVLRAILMNPAALVALAFPLISLAILWWMWKQIPAWFRKAIYDLLKRKRDREDGRDR